MSRKRIVWTGDARADLDAIRDYIGSRNPQAAARTAARVFRAVEQLTDMADLGRPGRIAGTRELIVAGTPYLVPYRLRRGRIEILRVYHSARQWPDRL